MEQLERRIIQILDKCATINVTISKKKFTIGTEIPFAGFLISDNGIKPDPQKTVAIASFPSPKNITDLRSFLGLANQLAFFLPDFSHLTCEMRKLLSTKNAFLWLEIHENEFRKLKEVLTSELLVKTFDPKLTTMLLTDASCLNGLGYALLQKENDTKLRLIACGSCSLSETQNRYATIELECLAIQYAISKCRFYLLGLPTFEIITDHKPLLGIFEKYIFEVDNPRLQRLREKMQAYNFTVKWVSGKLHLIADALSRAPHFSPHSKELTVETTFAVLAEEHPQCNQLLECLTNCICPAYKDLLTQIRTDFSSQSLSTFAKSYKNLGDRLSIYSFKNKEFILLDCRQIIIPPPEAIPFLLKNFHSAHVGIERTVRLAKQFFFWHGMLNDLTTTIDSCKACQMYTPSQKKKVIQSHTLLKAAFSFQECASDLFTLNGNEYIILVDRLTGFLCCDKLQRTTTSAILIKLTNWFNILGWPEKIRSDGGPQFRSEFNDFCKSFYIDHELSSPYHPESNGLAEAAVKNAKNLLKKCELT